MDRSINSGASLVEISIAILIVGLSTILIMSFSRNSFTMINDARGVETANILAQDKFTELSAVAFPVAGSDTVAANNMKYIRAWSVKDTGFIKRAIVNVKYTVGKKTKAVNFMGALN